MAKINAMMNAETVNRPTMDQRAARRERREYCRVMFSMIFGLRLCGSLVFGVWGWGIERKERRSERESEPLTMWAFFVGQNPLQSWALR